MKERERVLQTDRDRAAKKPAMAATVYDFDDTAATTRKIHCKNFDKVERITDTLLSDRSYVEYLVQKIKKQIYKKSDKYSSLRQIVDEVVDSSFQTFGLFELIRSLESERIYTRTDECLFPDFSLDMDAPLVLKFSEAEPSSCELPERNSSQEKHNKRQQKSLLNHRTDMMRDRIIDGENSPRPTLHATNDVSDILAVNGTEENVAEDSDCDTVDRGRPLGITDSLDSIDEYLKGANGCHLSQEIQSDGMDRNQMSFTQTQRLDNVLGTSSVAFNRESITDSTEQSSAAVVQCKTTPSNADLEDSKISIPNNSLEELETDRDSDKVQFRDSLDSPELLVTSWDEVLSTSRGVTESGTRVYRSKYKQVRFIDEDVKNQYGVSLVTSVVVTKKYSVDEIKEMFYSHSESTRFHTDYDIEVDRATAEGLSWIEWMEKRTDEDIAEEEQALREVMAMNAALIENDLSTSNHSFNDDYSNDSFDDSNDNF